MVGEQQTRKPVIRVECGSLSAFDQLAWIVLCAGLRRVAATAHVIEVSADGLSPECREILASGMLEGCFPGAGIIVSALPREPASAQDFVVVSGSAVLTGSLLARFSDVYVRPSAAPGSVDTALYLQELADERCWQALSKVVDEGLLPGTGPELFALYRRIAPSGCKVTLITSVFRGDAFLDGFLENAAALRGYAEHEHFLVRAASPGDEHATLLEYVRAQPSVVYVNLAEDPGLYDVWNLVTCLASGQYLTSANLDDRRSPDHLLKLVHVLETNPGVDVVSSALRVTHTPNVPWETSGNCKTWYNSDAHPKGEYAWQALFRTTPEGKTASRNMPHCMPVWRRAMHGSHGFFHEREFGPSADWEFWLRCGTRGARLYLLPEPLGLYLKRADSYWNVAAVDEDFDAKIIQIYHPRNDEDEAQRAEGRVAEGLAELPVLVRGKARFMYFHRLVQLAAEASVDRNRIDADALAEFGVANFSRAVAGAVRVNLVVSGREAFVCAQRFLAEQNLENLDVRQLDNWRRMIADYGAMTTCLDEAMLAMARLYWLRRERDAAWRLMKEAYRQRREHFWPVFQVLFRFTLPLADVTERLTAGAIVVPRRAGNAQSVNLWYYPDFQNNAYQANLYEPLKAGGASVRAIGRNACVDIEPEDPAATNVLHIHWIHTVFNRRRGEQPADAAREFLAEVRRARERGVRVLWTVHNYLSHQGKHRAVELALRRDLAELVDDVYLHHPMLRDQLDWLPENVVPKLMEHGSYALAEDWERQRQQVRTELGLPENAKVVVCAGQLRPYKQLETYLPQLLDWVSRTPDAWLLVLGQISSDEVREMLSSANAERVLVVDRFLPESELNAYLCAADFGFLSYTAILTSGTLFHMLSRALPVIAPIKGTIPAYVVEGWNGYLYDNVEMAEAALEALSGLDEKAVARLRENALSVARNLRWEFRLDPDNSARRREDEKKKRAEALQVQNAELAAQVERARIAERSCAEDRDALLDYAVELEARYQRVLKSRTWKMMAPMRVAGRWLRVLLTGRRPAKNSLPKRPVLRSRS